MVLIDDFEDGDVSEYGLGMELSTNSHSGTYAGHVQATDAISTSGLNAYPAPGDSFEVWVNLGFSSAYSSFAWGGVDSSNAYLVRHDPDGDMFIYKKSGGSYSLIASDSANTYGASRSYWTRHVIDWGTSGGIAWTVYDDSGVEQASLSATDTTYQSQGGFGSVVYGGAGGCYIDDAYILGGGGSPPAAPTGLTLTEL